MDDTITAKDVEELRDALLSVHVTLPVYMAHPEQRDHLARHGGGLSDCDTCVAIWMDLTARGRA